MDIDPACAVAHGDAPAPTTGRSLVAVFASPLAGHLRHFGADLGWRVEVYEPSVDHHASAEPVTGSAPTTGTALTAGTAPTNGTAPTAGAASAAAVADLSPIGADTDVVVTDHHRPELGPVLRDVLDTPARWVGVIGSPRHTAPHVAALEALGVPPEQIARVHRPIGLNIGARTPPEIALAILAGLIADRTGRPGGFDF